MRDAFPVRGIQRIENLAGVLDHLSAGTGPFRARPLSTPSPGSSNPLVQSADVRMIERCHCPRLALEALAEVGLGYLQCDRAIQPRVRAR